MYNTCIYSVVRMGFSLSKQSKTLDLSYKTDPGFWDCSHLIPKLYRSDLHTWSHFGREKLSYTIFIWI